ncbi:Holliday junction resolvase RecU [Orenia marismortui]|uniref:Holliday junction resolvase RecU n=1 Tax=Orenia marismortui TaxID=46469 RepID=UPI00036701F8|nr:Holliday junction resolvase RecU [Orenia marismortui]
MYYGGRGQLLEQMIEESNKQYSLQQIAVIQKIPTPVKVLNVNNRTGRITNGFYDKKSTVDYIGVFQGVSIAFDAKETSVNTRFDLSNVKEHQYYYLKNWSESGGISFLIIQFTNLDESYYLPFEILDEFWTNMLSGGRKSIPYDMIAKDRYKIRSRGLIFLDYLSIVDDVLNEES